jgi:nucleoside-diphosphate-sugar epimerase
MKLFVTGGTGFIGSYFIDLALSLGHDVIAFRRLGSRSEFTLKNNLTWVEGKLDGIFDKELQGVDVFVHFASHTPNPPYAPLEDCLYWNVYAALKLANQAYEAGVKNYLIAGSCFEYGDSANDYEFIPVEAPLKPRLPYPISKAAASLAFEGFARDKNVRLRLLRIFQVYGDGEQASRFWPSLKRAAIKGEDFNMTAGEQVRDFIPVQDVARQFIEHLDFKGLCDGEARIINVGTGVSQTLKEFAKYWWGYWGASGSLKLNSMPYRAGELMRLVPLLQELETGLADTDKS